MEDHRREWMQPQLIVLGRGTPEEDVLRGCKTSKLTGLKNTKNSCKKGAACAGTKCSVISKTS